MKSTARAYAGVLAVLAFLVTLCRGAIHGAGLREVLANGLLAMAVFLLIGGIVGWLGERTMATSVHDSALNEEG